MQSSPTRLPLISTFKVCLIVLLIQGCTNNSSIFSKDNLPLVHRIDIQQGNVITQDMLAKLELGMEKKKVRFIMGTPIINDTFHDDRWDYIYTYKKGRDQREQRLVTLYFKDGVLARIEGDVKAAQGVIPTDTRKVESVEVPPAEPPSVFSRVKDKLTFGKDKPKVDNKNLEDSAQINKSTSEIDQADSPELPETPGSETTSESVTTSTTESPESNTSDEEQGYFGKLWDKLGSDETDPEANPDDPTLRDPTDPEINPGL